MSWRNSPFFERQFEAITQLGDGSVDQPFVTDIRNARDDVPLLRFAEWLEERDDARGQYIRDMCDLAAGKRPFEQRLDRVDAFEERHGSDSLVFHRTIGHAFLLSVRRDAELEESETFREEVAFHLGAEMNIADLRRVTKRTPALDNNILRLVNRARGRGGFVRACVSNDGMLRQHWEELRLDLVIPLASSVEEAIYLPAPQRPTRRD